MKRFSWWVFSLSTWLFLIQPVFGQPKEEVWFIESPATFTLPIDQLFHVVLWITGIVFVLVQGSLFVSIFRSKQLGAESAYTPGNTMVEIVWTAIPVLILTCLVFFNQSVSSQVSGTTPIHNVEPKVAGEQFAWNSQYSKISREVSINEQSLDGQYP